MPRACGKHNQLGIISINNSNLCCSSSLEVQTIMHSSWIGHGRGLGRASANALSVAFLSTRKARQNLSQSANRSWGVWVFAIILTSRFDIVTHCTFCFHLSDCFICLLKIAVICNQTLELNPSFTLSNQFHTAGLVNLDFPTAQGE